MKNLLCALIAIASLSIGTAQATVIGDDVTLKFSESPGSLPTFGGTPTTATIVDPGTEFAFDDPSAIGGIPIFSWTVDFLGSNGQTLIIDALQQVFNTSGFARSFELTGFDDLIQSATLVSTNFSGGGGGGAVTFDDHSVTFSTGNFGFDSNLGEGGHLTAEIQIAVPEPGTVFLLLAGLAALGMARRRRLAWIGRALQPSVGNRDSLGLGDVV